MEQELSIRFDDRLVTYDFGELDEVSLAYAVTIHKSQGSESLHDRARAERGWRSGAASLGVAENRCRSHAISTFDEFQLPCSEKEYGSEGLVVS